MYLDKKQKIMEVLAFIVENNKDLKNFLRLKGMCLHFSLFSQNKKVKF